MRPGRLFLLLRAKHYFFQILVPTQFKRKTDGGLKDKAPQVVEKNKKTRLVRFSLELWHHFLRFGPYRRTQTAKLTIYKAYTAY